ncbi:hypothetical protein [Mesorhizobium sp. WSM3626]|nr:hypothetical protein [Mesorhizobium sp. WSM3626]
MLSAERPFRHRAFQRSHASPPIGIGALDQYFIRAELEVSMCQMDREPLQFPVPGERISDFLQAGKILVIKRRRILKLQQHRPLHGLNRSCMISAP